MKKIYLYVLGEGYSEFQYQDISELRENLTGRNIMIGENATIGDNAKIGYDAKIGENATIGNGATIGENATIGNYATIGENAKIGNGATIIKSLFITGSKHTVAWYSNGFINIGCHLLSIEEWIERFKTIGANEGYNEEYKAYIDICAAMQKTV